MRAAENLFLMRRRHFPSSAGHSTQRKGDRVCRVVNQDLRGRAAQAGADQTARSGIFLQRSDSAACGVLAEEDARCRDQDREARRGEYEAQEVAQGSQEMRERGCAKRTVLWTTVDRFVDLYTRNGHITCVRRSSNPLIRGDIHGRRWCYIDRFRLQVHLVLSAGGRIAVL